jgi:hypothetical protein
MERSRVCRGTKCRIRMSWLVAFAAEKRAVISCKSQLAPSATHLPSERFGLASRLLWGRSAWTLPKSGLQFVVRGEARRPHVS